MLLSLDIVVILKAVGSQQLLDFHVWTWGDLVNHRPGEGNLCLVLQIVEELGRHQFFLHPAFSIGKDTSLHLVAIVRTVVHRLYGEGQLSCQETLKEQTRHLSHCKDRIQTTGKVSLVVAIAFLGDGERYHLKGWIAKNVHQTLPVGKLIVGLESLGNAGDDLLLDRTVGAEVDAERQVIIGSIGLVNNFEVEGLGHDDATVIFPCVQRIVKDGCREGAEDVTTAKVYPCRFLGSLLANGLDVKLWEFIAFLLPFCGIVLAAENIVEFHFYSF